MKKIMDDVGGSGNIVEIRLMGRLHFLVIVTVMLVIYFALRTEVSQSSQLNHHAIELQDNKIVDLRKQLDSLQDQQSNFCLQYEKDMDLYFRSKPEFLKHPWVCSK